MKKIMDECALTKENVMLSRILSVYVFAAVIVCSPFVFTGCDGDVALNLSADSTVTYKVTESNQKQVKFERPSENTVSDKVTKSQVTITFDQKVTSVEDGNAIADITVKALSYNSKNSKGGGFSFNSSKDTNAPMAALIGQSYTIKITADGKASLLDGKVISSAVRAGRDSKIAKALFSADSVARRHGIAALQGREAGAKKWTVVEKSPKAMMQSKDYEKIYEVVGTEKIDGQKIAVVDMTTIPAASGGMGGMFAMFGDKIEADFKDEYVGQLKLNIQTGAIVSYYENLDTSWTAVDTSKATGDKAPDMLIIGFMKTYKIEAIN